MIKLEVTRAYIAHTIAGYNLAPEGETVLADRSSVVLVGHNFRHILMMPVGPAVDSHPKHSIMRSKRQERENC